MNRVSKKRTCVYHVYGIETKPDISGSSYLAVNIFPFVGDETFQPKRYCWFDAFN